MTKILSPSAHPSRPLVVALHCSGGSGRQWRALAECLDGSATLVAPDLIGTPEMGPWCGQGVFTLTDEAAPILALIDSAAGPVHIVGHSYGGALALQVAALRPARIASLALYEPCAFHLLPDMGPEGVAALGEIQAVARAADEGLLTGDYAGASRLFFDYWNGTGAFASLKPSVRDAVLRYLPKTCLDFRALFGSRVRLEAYRRLSIPILILQGEHARRPTGLIARRLHAAGKRTSHRLVRGAGHMGPQTHAAEVAALIGEHVLAAQMRPTSAAAAA
jgi:pimeloyl-ACP methyl ester carboxylesterase